MTQGETSKRETPPIPPKDETFIDVVRRLDLKSEGKSSLMADLQKEYQDHDNVGVGQ